MREGRVDDVIKAQPTFHAIARFHRIPNDHDRSIGRTAEPAHDAAGRGNRSMVINPHKIALTTTALVRDKGDRLDATFFQPLDGVSDLRCFRCHDRHAIKLVGVERREKSCRLVGVGFIDLQGLRFNPFGAKGCVCLIDSVKDFANELPMRLRQDKTEPISTLPGKDGGNMVAFKADSLDRRVDSLYGLFARTRTAIQHAVYRRQANARCFR
jgi:hypothetical protein